MVADRPFSPTTFLYHVTHPDNVESIEREGLQAGGDGRIYAFTDLLVADNIACGQVFANPYSLFRICPGGITGDLLADDVAEFSAPFHCVIRQDRIAPEHLRYLGTMHVQEGILTPWQWMIHGMRGLSRSQIESMFGLAGVAQ